MEGAVLELSTLCTPGESIIFTLGRFELVGFTMCGGEWTGGRFGYLYVIDYLQRFHYLQEY
jgi:hypothetical protein